ncbi:MAG: polysaccharide deacetylase family protein [Chloroflexota bacterium]
MKQRTANLLYYSGALRVLDTYWGSQRLTVLAYHRITDATQPNFDHYRPNVSATPEMFAQQIAYVARHFNAIDLETLNQFVTRKVPLPARPLLITFDDGYLDNYTNAFPILRAHHLPAVIFLMTNRMNQTGLPWWDECAYYFHHTHLSQPPLTGSACLDDPDERTLALESLIRQLKPMNADEQRSTLNAISSALDVEPPPEQQQFISWGQARELVANRVACQPHTFSHPRLSLLSEEAAQREIAQSCAQILAETGQQPLAFAYPFGMPGDFTQASLQALRDVHLNIAFTLSPGPVFLREVEQHPLEIPRVLILHQDSFRVFLAKLMGIHRIRERPDYLESHKEDGEGHARLRD